MRLREPQPRDTSRICDRVRKAIERAKGKPVVVGADPYDVALRIVEKRGGLESLLIDEGMLLVYQVGQPWYADIIVVSELMVLRLGEGGSFGDVCDLLDDIATAYNASAIHVGGALAASERALVRKYQQHGYTYDGSPGLLKWRNNG